MGQTYVWLDIFSIPQFHNGCKLLAVNSLYVYATAADEFTIIAPDSVHVSTGEFHKGCKLLAFNSFYVYAMAADGIIIAPVSVHAITCDIVTFSIVLFS